MSKPKHKPVTMEDLGLSKSDLKTYLGGAKFLYAGRGDDDDAETEAKAKKSGKPEKSKPRGGALSSVKIKPTKKPHV